MTAFHWALLTAFFWGAAPLFEKFGISKIEPFSGLILRCLGVVLGLILVIIFRTQSIKEALAAKPQTVIFIMLGGILASVVGQMFFYRALKLGELSKVVPVAAGYPIISFILGVIFLSEKVTLAKISGVSLVILGVVLLR
ncbi:MAG: hypothetical protein FJZ10_01475 [Candidatus Omnitrophica bacterium]|nr:hypothetical protein [Candidatus Omnitrophota bacterium]